MTMTNEEALRAKAEASCRAAEGDDWDQMFSGEQEARIEAWLDGYKVALQDAIKICNDIAKDEDYGDLHADGASECSYELNARLHQHHGVLGD